MTKRGPGMQPVELKAVRGILGLRAGHNGPLPVESFAERLGVSTEVLTACLEGQKAISAKVAAEARRLRAEALESVRAAVPGGGG